MDTNDFAFIESQLRIVLPTVFMRFMQQFAGDAQHRLLSDGGELATHAELFVIHQLEFFGNDRSFDYYELQPNLRSRRFVEIGGDGCGNCYLMPGDDRTTNELWFWEHDPYEGLSLCDDRSLSDYLSGNWELVRQDDPFAEAPAGRTVVCRTDHPARSIRQPITMPEWLSYVSRHPHMELDEYATSINPFTKEEIRIRRWPGRARLSVPRAAGHIRYTYGRVVLSADDGNVTPMHIATMKQIARDLEANLL